MCRRVQLKTAVALNFMKKLTDTKKFKFHFFARKLFRSSKHFYKTHEKNELRGVLKKHVLF